MTLEELITERDKQLQDANEKIADLEDQIFEFEENDVGISLSDSEMLMIDIISREISRLSENSKKLTLDKDDVKKFDTLVKDFVAIRGKVPTTKEKVLKDKDEEVADKLSVLYADK